MKAERAAPAPAQATAGPSRRVQLARLAWETALATDGVVGGDAGGVRRWQTEDRGETLPGVLVAAHGGARFDVELHLIAAWPTAPLHEVGRTIRERIATAAARAGLAEALGSLTISFGDLAEPPDEAA